MAKRLDAGKTQKDKKPQKGKARGRPFQKGNPGGPGRPRRQTETEYLDTLRETVTLDDWREICLAMVDKAKGGDVRAFEALCKWAMPAHAIEAEIERSDEDPEGLA